MAVIHFLYALKLKLCLRIYPVSKSFYYAIRQWTLFNNNSNYSRSVVLNLGSIEPLGFDEAVSGVRRRSSET